MQLGRGLRSAGFPLLVYCLAASLLTGVNSLCSIGPDAM